jgi:hypothetical protein
MDGRLFDNRNGLIMPTLMIIFFLLTFIQPVARGQEPPRVAEHTPSTAFPFGAEKK